MPCTPVLLVIYVANFLKVYFKVKFYHNTIGQYSFMVANTACKTEVLYLVSNVQLIKRLLLQKERLILQHCFVLIQQ